MPQPGYGPGHTIIARKSETLDTYTRYLSIVDRDRVRDRRLQIIVDLNARATDTYSQSSGLFLEREEVECLRDELTAWLDNTDEVTVRKGDVKQLVDVLGNRVPASKFETEAWMRLRDAVA